jgi:hypothetical protein
MSTTSCSVTPRGRDLLDLIGAKIALFKRGDLALRLAQVEEQLLLVRGGAHFHERPRTQDVFLDRCLDPPHRIGGEAEALLGLEPLDRLHQADIAFRDDLGNRQAVAAITHGDFGHEPEMAGDELMRRIAVVMLPPTLGQHVLLLWLKHREFANFSQVVSKTGFSVENRKRSCTGHVAPSRVHAPDSGGRGRPSAVSKPEALQCSAPGRSQRRCNILQNPRGGKNKTWSRRRDPG